MTALTANGRHVRWRELAATALDFPLSAGEAADLAAHLASCPACARLADNLRLDATALGRPALVPTSYRVDNAIGAAIAGRERRPSASRTLLLVAATTLLLVAILGAAAVGAILWRTLQPLLVVDASPAPPAVVVESTTGGPFDAVFIRPPAAGGTAAPSTIVAIGADGAERVLATVPGVEMGGAPWMAISEAGHLALLLRDGDQVSWAIVDTNAPVSQPIPVVLPGRDDTDRGYAVWGPGERLAIVLSPSSDDQAVAFVDPTTGEATIHPVPISQHNCFANRCGAWAADGSGFVLGPGGAASPLAILDAGGDVDPFASRVQPSSMGTRDVNASGDVLLGGTKPGDVPGPANGLSVHPPGGADRVLLPLSDVELADRAWAADGRDAWLLTAVAQAAGRSVTLERFSPPATRIPVASFEVASDVTAPDVWSPAGTFAGIAPDDSLAVIEVPLTSSEPVARASRLVELGTGASRDVDGSFVGWLAPQELPLPSPAITEPPALPTALPAFVPATWRRIDDAPNVHVVAAERGSGWLAFGEAGATDETGSPSVPVAWASPDGETWTRTANLPLPEGAQTGQITYVATGPQGFVAIGTAGRDEAGAVRGAVWLSPDGSSWTLVGSGEQFDLGECFGGCPELTTVAAGPAGILVAGYATGKEDEPVEILLWASPDARTWTRTVLPIGDPRAILVEPASVAATEAGFVATGRVETTDDSRAMAWTSPDGIAWSSPVDLPDGEGTDPRRIVTTPGATIIAGVRWLEDETTVGVAWSWTGGQWTTVNLPDTGTLVACGEAFVLVGSSGEVPTPWTSRDGQTWERGTPSADPDAPGPGASVLDTACAADRLLVMGWQGEVERSVFWVSP